MLRCKEGDLALVIHDEPGCRMNVGRVVVVRGPVVSRPPYGPTWLIQPVQPEAWAVAHRGGVHIEMPPLSGVEHPDAWLLPLRPPETGWTAERDRERGRPVQA
jgi:hypothetical protein